MQSSRAALYARYSSDLQHDRSIDDQLALCRAYAQRQGHVVVTEHADRAKTGASVIGRDGLIRLLDDVRAGKIDVVVVESLDRLSRDIEDLAAIHKRIAFAGARIETVGEGIANVITVGLRGIVGQLFLADLRDKVRRGMAGRVREGLFAGGRPYGYRPVPGKPGELEIVDDEAETVRRIFAEYDAGSTPRTIAAGLNRDGIAPPRGSRWNASTINGSAERGNGMLRSPLYAGRIVWGRTRMIRDPDTGRRVSRPNAPGDHQEAEAPHLAIIDPDLFARVQERRGRRARDPDAEPLQRSKRLLSGLLRCGSCGGPMTVRGRDRGGVRIGCSAHQESGVCDHGRRYYAHKIEGAVIDLLRAQLASPDALAAYLEAYREERRAEAAAIRRDRTSIEKRLADVKSGIARIVDAIASGVLTPEEARPRIEPLRAELPDLEARLASIEDEGIVVELHPQAVNRYRADIERLHVLLPDLCQEEGIAAEIRTQIAALVDRVIVRPAPPYQIDVEVIGRLAALTGSPLAPAGRMSAMGAVAEERSDREKRQLVQSFGRFRS